jgi:hypothetical protein
MECPKCQCKVTGRDARQRRSLTCGSKISWLDEWRWLGGLSCGLLAIVSIIQWFSTRSRSESIFCSGVFHGSSSPSDAYWLIVHVASQSRSGTRARAVHSHVVKIADPARDAQ